MLAYEKATKLPINAIGKDFFSKRSFKVIFALTGGTAGCFSGGMDNAVKAPINKSRLIAIKKISYEKY